LLSFSIPFYVNLIFVMEAVRNDPANETEGRAQASPPVPQGFVPPSAGLFALADFIANMSEDDVMDVDEDEIEVVESGIVDLATVNGPDSAQVAYFLPIPCPLPADFSFRNPWMSWIQLGQRAD
jgi:hypothetical protein